VQLLNVGAGLYDSAEAASVSLLQGASGAVNAPAQALLGHPLIGGGILRSAANSLATALGAPTPAASSIAFIMGGTLNAQPDPSYVAAINGLFIQPNPNFTGFNPFGLYTPEGANIPGISGVTLAQSVAEGELILNNAIMGLPTGTQALVFGYSQSAAVATLEMRALDALPSFERPSPSDLSFMLIGDIDNPNAGSSPASRSTSRSWTSRSTARHPRTLPIPPPSTPANTTASPTSRNTRSTSWPTSTPSPVPPTCTRHTPTSRRRKFRTRCPWRRPRATTLTAGSRTTT